jgi:NTE family protein
MDEGLLEAVGVSAYNFKSGRTATFVQSHRKIHWERTRRYSVSGPITPDHVMASCSIPILFPSHQVDEDFYGDGSFRNMAQLSPIIQMGAQRVLIFGVRGPNEIIGASTTVEPGIAQLSGMILNALFFDSLIIDMERVRRINDIVSAISAKSDVVTERSDYSVIDFKVMHPSRDLSQIAASKSVDGFPKSISFLLAGLGSRQETAELASYILFDKVFTRDLIDLGYNDTISQKSDLIAWF